MIYKNTLDFKGETTGAVSELLEKNNIISNNVPPNKTGPSPGSAQVQILLMVCQRFMLVRISDDGDGSK